MKTDKKNFSECSPDFWLSRVMSLLTHQSWLLITAVRVHYLVTVQYLQSTVMSVVSPNWTYAVSIGCTFLILPRPTFGFFPFLIPLHTRYHFLPLSYSDSNLPKTITNHSDRYEQFPDRKWTKSNNCITAFWQTDIDFSAFIFVPYFSFCYSVWSIDQYYVIYFPDFDKL